MVTVGGIETSYRVVTGNEGRSYSSMITTLK
jgi:hypothetical protein